MALKNEPFIKNLVVDAAGFLKLTSLEKIGEQIYTTRDVVDEIRDHATKQRLQVLPYELHYVEPTPENLKHVTEFSKKTGDFPSLSATDLRLIAAVYQLEKEHGDVNRLRNEPIISKTYSTTKKLLENPKEIVGFYLPEKDKAISEETEISSKLESVSLSSPEVSPKSDPVPAPQSEEEASAARDSDSDESSGNDEEEDSDEEREDSEQADDDDGWITPDNVQTALNKVRRDEGGDAGTENGQPISVACLSTDFAVQNVLLHMGLHLTSVDGILIKRLRTYVLRCFGCFKTTSVMTKRFCPECGHPTLKKVAVTVNPDTGILEYHLSKRKRISARGTRFSLPTFKGGKHAKNPVLFEDQRTPENRLSKKAMQRLDVLDPDYVARDSPFLMNDVTSRSAVIGVRSIQKSDARRNPNDWKCGRKRGGKRR